MSGEGATRRRERAGVGSAVRRRGPVGARPRARDRGARRPRVGGGGAAARVVAPVRAVVVVARLPSRGPSAAAGAGGRAHVSRLRGSDIAPGEWNAASPGLGTHLLARLGAGVRTRVAWRGRETECLSPGKAFRLPLSLGAARRGAQARSRLASGVQVLYSTRAEVLESRLASGADTRVEVLGFRFPGSARGPRPKHRRDGARNPSESSRVEREREESAGRRERGAGNTYSVSCHCTTCTSTYLRVRRSVEGTSI